MRREARACVGAIAVALAACARGAPARAPRPAPPAPTVAALPSCPPAAPRAHATSRPRQIVEGRYARAITQLAFSPDGALLATGSLADGRVRIWDAVHGRELRTLRTRDHFASHALLAGWAGPMRLALTDSSAPPLVVDIGTGAAAATFDLTKVDWMKSIRARGEGAPRAWLARRDDRALLLDGAGHTLGTLTAPRFRASDVDDVAVSPDGSTLAAWDPMKRGLSVWSFDGRTASTIAELATTRATVHDLALLPDGSAAVVGFALGGDAAARDMAADDAQIGLLAIPRGGAPARLGEDALLAAPRFALPKTPRLGSVLDIALSPDGAWLAAGFEQGLAVWRTHGRALAWARATGARAEELAFSPDGRTLAAGEVDGEEVRLSFYDASRGLFERALGGQAEARMPRAVARAGGALVVATEATLDRWSLVDATLERVVVLPPRAEALLEAEGGARALAVIAEPTADGLALSAVAVGEAGPPEPRPLTGGRARAVVASATRLLAVDWGAGRALVRVPSAQGGEADALVDLASGARTELPDHSTTDTPRAFFAARALTTFGDRAIALFDPTTGARRASLPLGGVAYDGAVSSDGARAAVAWRHSVAALALPSGARSWSVDVDGWPSATAVQSDGALAIGGADGSVALARGGDAKTGALAWRSVSTGGYVNAVAPLGDVLVTLHEDRAARVWDAAQGSLRATLYDFADDEWLAVTPGGAYTGTAEASDRIGWVFDAPLEQFDFAQFSGTYRDPAVVRRRLAGGAVDVDDATAVTRPPRLALTTAPPARTDAASIDVRVHAASASRVDVVRAYVEGREVDAKPVCAAEGDVTLRLPLLPGANKISVVAFDDRGFASNEALADVDSTLSGLAPPDVWVVSVGESRYPHLLDRVALAPDARAARLARFQLPAAGEDARGIAATFTAMAGPGRAYAAAHVTTLLDAGAADVRTALGGLARMKPNDVAIVFFAGHGLKASDDADMVFVTSGAELAESGAALAPESMRDDAIGWSDISAALARASGRVVVLLDACHAGDVSRELVVANDDLAGALVRERRAGAVVFAASKGRQYSLEPDTARALRLDVTPSARSAVRGDDHGFFTGALLASLESDATDHDGDGALQLSEVIDEVTRRVTKASGGAQTPWVARRELFGDFKLANAP